jgi:uncharacterized surface protein with fasciclin (FAS1) repeats
MLKKLPFLFSLVLVLAVATTGVISAKSAEAAPPQRTTIVDTALAVNAQTGEFSSLIAALTKVDTELNAGLIPLLDGNRQFTVFAPTDAAFDAAAEAVLGPGFTGADLVAGLDAELLLSILTYHVAPGNRDAASVLGSTQVRTLSKSFVYPYVDMNGSAFLRDVDSLGLGSPDAQITGPNVFASNGVIHVINWVLLP